ncbi:hypothetical protein T01_10631 [Trichinella spiralis]|uniref:Uncharacterized protein n=1 Tax=Trichinella spiralis TaxID=6334 RepID=A0A0V1BQI5_TRISP|nr:hypothetical protein T01_10631 [Trichinella spiralis]
MDAQMDSVITNTGVSEKYTMKQEEFLFGLQNIVKSKYTLLECWGGPHLTLKKHVSKNSVHDVFSSCELSFVKFVEQITDLSRARYSAHFDIKLSSIVIFLVPKRLLSSS